MRDLGQTLIQLLYISRPAPGVGLDDLHTIVRDAQKRNSQLGITGILSFGRHYFLQALEGQEYQVNQCLDTIRSDSRHSDIQVIYQHAIEERWFPAWPMAYVPKPLLIEILRSAGLPLDWTDVDAHIRSWDKGQATQALSVIRREPQLNIAHHNPSA